METVLDYKCPSCGGRLEFDTATRKMKCPFCDSLYDVEELKSIDKDLENGEAADIPGEDEYNREDNTFDWGSSDGEHIDDGVRIYVCGSCGGELICDKNTIATHCPYCDNPVVISEHTAGILKPDFVIPFKFDKKAAKEKYLEYIKGKFLLPKIFKEQNHIDEIKGLYVPFWLYDSKIHARAKYDATRVRHWSDSKYDYTETSRYAVIREGNMEFSKIPVDGSEKMEDDLMESIEPFDFNEAVDFQTAYLAGYIADKYDVDEKSSEKRADYRIHCSAVEAMRDTFSYSYTTVSSPESSVCSDNPLNGRSSSVSITEGKTNYALYPVWILNSTYKGKKYRFAMNGQTGKFVGNLPVNKTKAILTFASVAVTVGALATALIYLFM